MDKYESRIIPNEVCLYLTLEPPSPQEHPHVLDEAEILFQKSKNWQKKAIGDFLQFRVLAIYHQQICG